MALSKAVSPHCRCVYTHGSNKHTHAHTKQIQIYNFTSQAKHDLCDFEISLRIQIRHDSGKEREKFTNNGNHHFFHFFQFFKTLERTFSSSVGSHNSFKRKMVSNRKGKSNSSCIWHPKKGCFKNVKKKQKQKTHTHSAPQARPQATHVLASAATMGRGHMECTLQTILSTTCLSVCGSFSLSLLPCPSRPCQPPPPTRASQLRCDLWPRPK